MTYQQYSDKIVIIARISEEKEKSYLKISKQNVHSKQEKLNWANNIFNILTNGLRWEWHSMRKCTVTFIMNR